MATRAAYSDMFRTSMSDGLAAGTCFAWLCEIVIVESSWLTTTEYSLASQGSSRVCETVRLSVGGKPGAISSRKGQKLSTNQNQHELSAAANRWIFVTPARMFLPLLSLSRILPAVMLSSGISILLSYNISLDASGTTGLVIDNLSVTWLSPAASTQTLGRTCFGFDKMARLIDSNASRCVTCLISS